VVPLSQASWVNPGCPARRFRVWKARLVRRGLPGKLAVMAILDRPASPAKMLVPAHVDLAVHAACRGGRGGRACLVRGGRMG
jgi:hypothetical protein